MINKKIFTYAFILASLFLLAIFLTVFVWIINFQGFLKSLNLENNNKYLESSLIVEKESTLNRELFQRFSVFSDKDEQISALNIKGITSKSSLYLVEDDFELDKILSNKCIESMCLKFNVDIMQTSSSLWKTLLAVEDNRFITHHGFDVIAILRALWTDLKEQKFVQGGSTITQQLIKNIYLTNEKTFIRKIKEAILSYYLESIWTKEEVITRYLQEVFWGSYKNINIWGAEAAARVYFKKGLSEINTYESIILISMLKGPNLYSPFYKKGKYLRKRVETLHRKLFHSDNVNEWSEDSWNKWLDSFSSIDYLAVRSFAFASGRERLLDGLSLFDTYLLTYFSEKKLRELKGKEIAYKISVHNLATDESWFNYSKFQRSNEKAFNEEYHQIGSLIKPILFSIYFKSGIQPESYVSTEKISIKTRSTVWEPRDSSRAQGEIIQVKTALQKSRNIPTVRLANEVGFDFVENQLIEFVPRLQKPLSDFPAQLLGAVELSFKEITDLYIKLIRKECLEYEKNNSYISPIDLMKDPSLTTLSRAHHKLYGNTSIFGKTGTTNNSRDNWFVAWEGKFLYLLWYGKENLKKDENLKIFGATSSFVSFQNYILSRGKRFSETNCFLIAQ